MFLGDGEVESSFKSLLQKWGGWETTLHACETLILLTCS